MKNKMSIFSLLTTCVGSCLLAILIGLSDELYNDVSNFFSMPLYYQILVYVSVSILVLGLILSFIFKNEDNTKAKEAYIEASSVFLGIIFMFTALVRNESKTKEIIIYIGLILFMTGLSALLSTAIGFFRKSKLKKSK